MKRFLQSIVMVCWLFASSVSAGEIHWSYSGEQGPENWAQLTTDFSACSGKNQSPINLTGFIEAELEPLGISYQPGGKGILNNGHTIQVDYASGSSISFDNTRFGLQQFHFHAPSENHINGRSYPMEAHLVHLDEDDNIAVLTIMFDEGVANLGLKKIWKFMPENAGDKKDLPSPFDVSELLPASTDYYRFNGSLTTPPCSEGVRWLVLKDPVSASREQIETFSAVMGHPNNRPLQPVGARFVLQ